ncbi:DUF732 domain-containing protein [Mycobacterium sp. NPDC051198]
MAVLRFLAAQPVSVLAAVAIALSGAPTANADAVAYLINVTVRPGYGFPNADAALAYGHDVCDRVARGRPYPELIGEVKADFADPDEYQAAYLINQAVNELCPALIWQLRQSAAHYRPSGAS